MTSRCYTWILIFVLLNVSCALSPNEKLIKCCHGDKHIDRGCAQKYCQIPKIAASSVFPFIAECSPKGDTVQRIWNCVSSRHDHTQCCINQGVLPLCLAYCNATGKVPTDMLKYGICVGEFEKFRVCFRSYLKHHPNIRGDE